MSKSEQLKLDPAYEEAIALKKKKWILEDAMKYGLITKKEIAEEKYDLVGLGEQLKNIKVVEEQGTREGLALFKNTDLREKYTRDPSIDINSLVENPPITTNSFLSESEKILSSNTMRNRMHATVTLVNRHPNIHINDVSKILRIPLSSLYRYVECLENKGILINNNGHLSRVEHIVQTPEKYNIFGFHDMVFSLDNPLRYGVYCQNLDRLNEKSTFQNRNRKAVERGNPAAEWWRAFVISSTKDDVQFNELGNLWGDIRGSFDTNRFILSSFELNIDVPCPEGTTIAEWGVGYSRRDLEGEIRAYRKNMNTFRMIDLPISLKEFEGIFRKPSDLLPLLDAVLAGYNAWRESERWKEKARYWKQKYENLEKEVLRQKHSCF